MTDFNNVDYVSNQVSNVVDLNGPTQQASIEILELTLLDAYAVIENADLYNTAVLTNQPINIYLEIHAVYNNVDVLQLLPCKKHFFLILIFYNI